MHLSEVSEAGRTGNVAALFDETVRHHGDALAIETSNVELTHAELREATRAIREDWDITEPALREAWEAGDKGPFYPYGEKSMERVMEEMAGAVDQYAGRADGAPDEPASG